MHAREAGHATQSVVEARDGRGREIGAQPASGGAAPVTLGALTAPGVLRLQRLAGNRAVGVMVARHQQRRITPVQRTCGGSCECASCAAAHARTGDEDAEVVQRDAGVVLQRQADPADLTGTQFESLDSMLKTKLADKTVFNWGSKATLAEALGELPNANIASMSRVGAMISASASFLWPQVRRITGAWITDNFGMGVEWSDPGGLAATLAASPGWCRDNPVTARWYHGSTNSFRQIPGQPGAASLHVTTSGRPDVHIDAHQPIEGKETRWPWAGQCNLDLSAWWDHAGDVIAGGGASGTAVGRYAAARGNINKGRTSPYLDAPTQQPKLTEASQRLDTIANNVQRYAAMGTMVGDEWEGDRQMLRDRPVMEALEHAERLINEVLIEQMQEEQRYQPPMM